MAAALEGPLAAAGGAAGLGTPAAAPCRSPPHPAAAGSCACRSPPVCLCAAVTARTCTCPTAGEPAARAARAKSHLLHAGPCNARVKCAVPERSAHVHAIRVSSGYDSTINMNNKVFSEGCTPKAGCPRRNASRWAAQEAGRGVTLEAELHDSDGSGRTNCRTTDAAGVARDQPHRPALLVRPLQQQQRPFLHLPPPPASSISADKNLSEARPLAVGQAAGWKASTKSAAALQLRLLEGTRPCHHRQKSLPCRSPMC